MNIRMLGIALLAGLSTVAAGAAGLENEYVSLTFGAAGEIASLVDKASGRELVRKVMPFAEVTLNDGTTLTPVGFEVKVKGEGEQRLVWSFEGGGALELSVTPFAGGWTFRSEAFTVEDAASCEYMRVTTTCNAYKGSYAHMMSDDEDAVCIRSYDLTLQMVAPGGQWGTSKWGFYKPVKAWADWGFTGHRCGLAAGPKDKIQKMLQAMTYEANVPMSTCGGAFCLGADANRNSYVFSYYEGRNFDEWLNMLDLTGIGTIHFHLWYSSNGHFLNINQKYFPGGLEGMRDVAERVHAAGHRVSLHTLSAQIAGPNPWVSTDRNTEILSAFQYTTLNALTNGVAELRVLERPDDSMATNAVYGSLGNYLRLGNEIVQYAGIRREEPYAFTGITRGSQKTAVVDHPAGTTAHYLRFRYGGFYPDTDLPVMDEIASELATVCNTVRIDRIFFDGAEGIGPKYTRADEYQIGNMINRLFSPLEQSEHPVQVESSCANSYTWWVRANSGVVDGAHYGRKVFDRSHLKSAAENRATNLLEPQLGWWAPGQLTDETDYYMSHVVGVDGAMSLYGWVRDTNNGPLGMHRQSELTVLGWYEHFRMAKAFNDVALDKYRDFDNESRLRQDANGVWQVEPYDCLDHRIDNAAKRTWTVERPAAGAAEPVIYLLGGSAPYDDPSAISVAQGSEASEMTVKTSAAKVKAAVACVVDGGHGECFRLTATNLTAVTSNAWAQAARTFEASRNCAPSAGVGFWVKGDGKGAMLDVRLAGSGPQDCLVKLDFTGWRYYEFVYTERDCETWSKYKWPSGGGWSQYSTEFDPKAVTSAEVILSAIPAGDQAGVEVLVSEIRALPARTHAFADLTLTVNGEAYALPFDAAESNDRIFLKDGYWVLRDGTGELKKKVATTDVVTLAAGENTVSFSANAPDGDLRADVKLLALGATFPALKPTEEWPEKWARHGQYEAMLPVEYCPAKGATTLPDLTIRPGERAQIEVHLVGEAAGAWLEYGTGDGFARLDLPDGKAGARVKCPGPVLTGVRPLRFGCYDSASADVRIEIVKHYVDTFTWASESAAAKSWHVPGNWSLNGEPTTDLPTNATDRAVFPDIDETVRDVVLTGEKDGFSMALKSVTGSDRWRLRLDPQGGVYRDYTQTIQVGDVNGFAGEWVSTAGKKTLRLTAPSGVQTMAVVRVGGQFPIDVASPDTTAFVRRLCGTGGSLKKTGAGGLRIGEVAETGRFLLELDEGDVRLDGRPRAAAEGDDFTEAHVAAGTAIAVPEGRIVRIGTLRATGSTFTKKGAGTLQVGRVYPENLTITVEDGDVMADLRLAEGDPTAPTGTPQLWFDADAEGAFETDGENVVAWKDCRGTGKKTSRLGFSQITAWPKADTTCADGRTTLAFPNAAAFTMPIGDGTRETFVAFAYTASPDAYNIVGEGYKTDRNQGGVNYLFAAPGVGFEKLAGGTFSVDGRPVRPFEPAGKTFVKGQWHVAHLSTPMKAGLNRLASNGPRSTTGHVTYGEVITYDAALTPAERAATIDYLMRKWADRRHPEYERPSEGVAVAFAGDATVASEGEATYAEVTGHGTLTKTGAGDATVRAELATNFTAVAVRNGSLTITKPAEPPDRSAFHFDATDSASFTDYFIDANGETNVNRWADTRGNGVYAYKRAPYSPSTGNMFYTTNPIVRHVQFPDGKTRPVLDFLKASYRNVLVPTGAAMYLSNESSVRRKVKEAHYVFGDGQNVLRVFHGASDSDFLRGLGGALFRTSGNGKVSNDILNGYIAVDAKPTTGAAYVGKVGGKDTFHLVSVAPLSAKDISSLGVDRSIEAGGGRFGECIAFTDYLPDAERAYLMGSLMHKWFGAPEPVWTNALGRVTLSDGATLAVAGGGAILAPTLSGSGTIDATQVLGIATLNLTVAAGTVGGLTTSGTAAFADAVAVTLEGDDVATLSPGRHALVAASAFENLDLTRWTLAPAPEFPYRLVVEGGAVWLDVRTHGTVWHLK